MDEVLLSTGQNRTVKQKGVKYKNIAPEHKTVYKVYALLVLQSRKLKEVFTRPKIFSFINSRARVHLIIMQSPAGGILVNHDHLTKFFQFQPVPCKCLPKIAYSILDIFTIFGAPSILQVSCRFTMIESLTIM